MQSIRNNASALCEGNRKWHANTEVLKKQINIKSGTGRYRTQYILDGQKYVDRG